MAARGGKRIGAGRKPGSLSPQTKRMREVSAVAVESGLAPLEIMLSNMRHFQTLAESAEAVISELSVEQLQGLLPAEQFKHLLAEVKKAAGLRDLAQGCARDAAPYVHQRLSASTVTVVKKRDATDWTRDELVAILHDEEAGGGGAASEDGCGDRPDQVH